MSEKINGKDGDENKGREQVSEISREYGENDKNDKGKDNENEALQTMTADQIMSRMAKIWIGMGKCLECHKNCATYLDCDDSSFLTADLSECSWGHYGDMIPDIQDFITTRAALKMEYAKCRTVLENMVPKIDDIDSELKLRFEIEKTKREEEEFPF